jgi:hypothetical protein
MKIILEFGEGEESIADIAAKAKKIQSNLLDFSEWLRAKDKWGNHGEEAQKAVEEIRASFYRHLGEYLNED